MYEGQPEPWEDYPRDPDEFVYGVVAQVEEKVWTDEPTRSLDETSLTAHLDFGNGLSVKAFNCLDGVKLGDKYLLCLKKIGASKN